MLQHLIIQFLLYYLSGGRLRAERLKTKEHFKFLPPKVVAVAYEMCLITRRSKYSDFTWKLLVCWKTGR